MNSIIKKVIREASEKEDVIDSLIKQHRERKKVHSDANKHHERMFDKALKYNNDKENHITDYHAKQADYHDSARDYHDMAIEKLRDYKVMHKQYSVWGAGPVERPKIFK